MTALATEAAAGMVSCAYAALDLFGGREDEMLEWARAMPGSGDAGALTPAAFDIGSAMALNAALSTAQVLSNGVIDPVRALQFREAVELLPHFQAEERRRAPKGRAQVVFTLPEGLSLGADEGHLARSLTVRLCEALGTAQDCPVLLASPYWSRQGTDILRPALDRAIHYRLPITLAGARYRHDERDDHLAAMLAFGGQLRADGATVTALRYQPPFPSSLFHAKLACGRTGYLGSANFTDHALGKHVEAGVPLAEVDVARIWWLVGVLKDAGVLVCS